MLQNQNPLIYLILQGKKLSYEMLRGIKITLDLHDIVDLDDDAYLMIKKLDNKIQRDSSIINTIQKLYDLLINKSIKIFIVDNIDTTETMTHADQKLVSLDELYTTLDFRYVAKLIHKGGLVYLSISYIPTDTDIQTTHLFPTSVVSKELFERSHFLNNYNTKGTKVEAPNNLDTEIKHDCSICHNGNLIDELNIKIKELNDKLAQIELDKIAIQNDNTADVIEGLNQQIKFLVDKNEDLEAEKLKMLGISNKSVNKHETDEDMISLEERISNLNRDNLKLTNELANLNKENNNLYNTIERLRDELNHHNDRAEDIHDASVVEDMASDNIQDIAHVTDNKLQAIIDDQTYTIQDLSHKLEEIQENYKDQAAEAKIIIDDLKKQILNQSNIINSLEQEKHTLANYVQQNINDKNQVQEDTKSSEHIKYIEQKLKEQHAEIQKLTQMLAAQNKCSSNNIPKNQCASCLCRNSVKNNDSEFITNALFTGALFIFIYQRTGIFTQTINSLINI